MKRPVVVAASTLMIAGVRSSLAFAGEVKGPEARSACAPLGRAGTGQPEVGWADGNSDRSGRRHQLAPRLRRSPGWIFSVTRRANG